MTHPNLQQRRNTINKTDPRVQRTLKLLGDTFITLISEKGYDTVSIQDITDRANVSRTTFYLHFKDKDELLFLSMVSLYDDLSSTVNAANIKTEQDLEAAMTDPLDFEHVQRYLNFYKVMLSEQGSMTFLLRILDYLTATMAAGIRDLVPANHALRVPIEVLAVMSAGAEIALIRWWINQEAPPTPAFMARVLYDAQMHGLWWALGFRDHMPPAAE